MTPARLLGVASRGRGELALPATPPVRATLAELASPVGKTYADVLAQVTAYLPTGQRGEARIVTQEVMKKSGRDGLVAS
jgi:hypothetical protein